MSEIIVVHPGGVHLDEIIAVGLICRERGVLPVERRKPTEEELADPEVWVVDVGEQHNASLRNFDHHQFAKDAEPECAMSLVARHLGVHDLLSTRPWYPAQVTIDSKGASALAKKLEMDTILREELASPMDLAIRQIWGSGGEGPVDEAVVRMASSTADALIVEAEAFKAVEECRRYTRVQRIGGVPVLLHNTIAADAVSNHLKAEWEQEHGETIAASISHDPREPFGWALYRYHDDPRIDFSLLEGDPRFEFVHKVGFMAKTKERLGLDEVEEFVRRSLT